MKSSNPMWVILKQSKVRNFETGGLHWMKKIMELQLYKNL